MTVVSFVDFLPPQRHDGNPWAVARIQESESEAGPWAVIEDISLSPIDSDPTNPLTRNFTTELAVLAAGWYRVVFIDSTGDEAAPSAPLYNSSTTIGWSPTVEAVASKIRARTRDSNGAEIGTFNPNTRPTYHQAAELIDQATGEVALIVGFSIDEELHESAKGVVALLSAMMIELGYFPESVQTNRSPYDQLERAYERALKHLEKAVAEAADGETVGAAGGSRSPSYGFPEDQGGLIGWGTDW